MGRFAVSCCVILWVIVRAPSDRPQGNLFLKSLIALKMHSPHLAGKKNSFKGADSLLQLPLTLCRSQVVKKKTVFSEFSTNRISVYSKVLLWYFYIAKAGKDCPIDQSHATGWELKTGTISTFFTVVAVSWCNPGLFPAGQTRAHKKRPALSWASDSKENSAESRALERWVNTKASGSSGFKQKSTAFNLL